MINSNLPMLFTSLINRDLTTSVCRIMLVIIITAMFIYCANGRSNYLSNVFQIMVITRLQPTKGLRIIRQEAATRSTLIDALLIITRQAIMSTLDRRHPYLLSNYVIRPMTNVTMFLRPIFLNDLLNAPERFTRRLGRRQIIFQAFRHRTPALRHFAVVVIFSLFSYYRVRIIRRLIRSSVRSRVTSRILRRARRPLILTMATVPLRGTEATGRQATF